MKKKVKLLIEMDENYYKSIKKEGSFSTATYHGELFQAIADATPITEETLDDNVFANILLSEIHKKDLMFEEVLLLIENAPAVMRGK